MKLCKCGCGKPVRLKKHEYIHGHNGYKLSDETRLKISKSNKGRIISKESRKKMSVSQKDEKCHCWKGGGDAYLHGKARELFGKDYCEHCNIHIDEYKNINKVKKQFEMHCIDRNYSNLTKNNWKNLCVKCHSKLHKK